MAQQYSAISTLSRAEHWITLIGGSALVVYGLARRSLGGALLVLLGGDLIYHELTHEDVHIHQVYGLEYPHDRPHADENSQPEGIKVQRSVTIDRSPEELYRFWRNLENIPRVFDYIQSVRIIDSSGSHWIAKTLNGTVIEWDTQITEDVPNQLISWRATQGASIPNSGSVHFTKSPYGKGTRINITLEFDPPPGPVGAAFISLLGDMPSRTTREQLSRLKQSLEAARTNPIRSSLRTIWETR